MIEYLYLKPLKEKHTVILYIRAQTTSNYNEYENILDSMQITNDDLFHTMCEVI